MSFVPPPYVALGNTQFMLRASDRLPSFVAEVVDDRGTPVDLTNATAWLTARRIAGKPVDDTYPWTGPVQLLVVDAAAGLVYYDWQEADTVTYPGKFHLLVQVEFADGTRLNVPSDVPAIVTIRDPLDASVTEQLLTLEDGTILTDSTGAALIVQADGDTSSPLLTEPGVFM